MSFRPIPRHWHLVYFLKMKKFGGSTHVTNSVLLGLQVCGFSHEIWKVDAETGSKANDQTFMGEHQSLQNFVLNRSRSVGKYGGVWLKFSVLPLGSNIVRSIDIADSKRAISDRS